MQIEQLMSRPVHACRPGDSLERAAQLMWEGDCGALAVVDDDGHLLGVVTDRDVCMAAYTQGRALSAIEAGTVMAGDPVTCRPEDSVNLAHEEMRRAQVRRLPVVDEAGRLVGMISLGDLAQHAVGARRKSYANVARTLAAITAPRHVALAAAEPSALARPTA